MVLSIDPVNTLSVPELSCGRLKKTKSNVSQVPPLYAFFRLLNIYFEIRVYCANYGMFPVLLFLDVILVSGDFLKLSEKQPKIYVTKKNKPLI